MKRYALPLIAAIVLFVGAGALYFRRPAGPNYRPVSQSGAHGGVQVKEARLEDFKPTCEACHKFPPPDTFPKKDWEEQIHTAYDVFMKNSPRHFNPPPLEAVLRWYQNHAPESLPLHHRQQPSLPLSVHLERHDYWLQPQPFGQGPPVPSVSSVNLVHLFSDKNTDILICNMHMNEDSPNSGTGQILALQPYIPGARPQVLATVPQPAHAEVCDLNGDGIKDIIVANLGHLNPTDARVGSVIWLQGMKDGTFKPVTLLRDVGRVADVQVADFNGDGKPDLIVAVFGSRDLGEVVYLENHTTDWNHPLFVKHIVDPWHGAINVPVVDLNHDGKPDFVALFAQEHETVAAFINQGNGRFRKEIIYAGPHPAYGSSGIQLVDFNHDGKIDVLYSNGDIFDPPPLLRPDNGVQWLENRGKFPFVHHSLTWMYGVQRAAAVDLTGKKLTSVLAVSLLPQRQFPEREKLRLDATILLDQVAPGKFIRHSLEIVTCNHFAATAGDVDGDGRSDLVIGNITTPNQPLVTIYLNKGPNPALPAVR